MKDNNYKKYISVDGSRTYDTKPEDLTQLRDNILIDKKSPRIKYRGMLDLSQSIVIEIQCLCYEKNIDKLIIELDSVLDILRKLMSSDVLCTSLGEYKIAGETPDDIRKMSHNPKEYFGFNHQLPSYNDGLIGCKLNYLRTIIRQTELSAIVAFESKTKLEKEYIKAINRLSSAVYVIYMRFITGYYNKY